MFLVIMLKKIRKIVNQQAIHQRNNKPKLKPKTPLQVVAHQVQVAHQLHQPHQLKKMKQVAHQALAGVPWQAS